MALSLAWGIDDSIIINNNKYELNLEFSRVLRWYEMWKDPDLSEMDKVLYSIILIVSIPWSDDPPTSIENLVSIIPQDDLVPLSNAIIKRIAGEQVESTTVKRDLKGNILEDEEKKWYEFEQDSGYIYSSFLMDYGMDLMEEREKRSLHWDKFNHLLAGLSENTKFKNVIKIRMMDYPEKATPSEIEEIRKAKLAVALKEDRSNIEFEMMDLKQKREYMLNQQEKRGEVEDE
ncbi:Gp15 family bacteriophage protein [Enterococcus gallinarum]|uniref:Gp15 family bacteriophage protein n=1 Tax=Enterococcus gallinarum TaxID=1353 RepID=UPI0022E459D8|nr:Gp15 family bacteriophage protein [Enterococcus gallinarum]